MVVEQKKKGVLMSLFNVLISNTLHRKLQPTKGTTLEPTGVAPGVSFKHNEAGRGPQALGIPGSLRRDQSSVKTLYSM
jgi:hypothetical protein